jgi:hypothetical protein
MSDLLVGLGVALVLEGLMWALAPGMAAKALHEIARSPPGLIRTAAWSVVGVGLLIVWAVRG